MADDVFSEGHYLIGLEGLALLRAGASRRLERVGERVAELRDIVERLEEPQYERRRDLPEHDVGTGYGRWAESYDDPGNDTIALEEPVVRGLLDALPAGPVLDAACGTGRHTGYLAAAGRNVIGLDSSAAMLARAREKLPSVEFRSGELTALPIADGSMSGVVCALALSHLPRLDAAIGELARVLRPGGRLVVSNPHPLATGILGWRAVFVDEHGERSMIPEHPHLHGEYIESFHAAGLGIRRCIEPRLSREAARARAKAGHEDAAEDALAGLPAVIVWETERLT